MIQAMLLKRGALILDLIIKSYALVLPSAFANVADPTTDMKILTPSSSALPRTNLPLPLPRVINKVDVAAVKRRDLTDKLEGSESVQSEATLRAHLLAVMARYKDMNYVPYVWGGENVGDRATCSACRACVAAKPHLKVERRAVACSACRSCGIDCSHFANRVLREAGLTYPYLPTKEMARGSRAVLREKFNLVDLGRDLSLAEPGDLLLYPKHVVLLLAAKEGGKVGDILHVSRAIKRRGMGGVEVVHDQDLSHFRGKLLRILRHSEIFDGYQPGSRLSQPRHMPTRKGRRGRKARDHDAPAALSVVTRGPKVRCCARLGRLA